MQVPFKPIPIVLVAGLSGLIGGALGVLLLVFMLLLTQVSLGREQAEKHGISERNASRMGGVAILLGTALFCGAALFNGGPDIGSNEAGLLRGYEWAALLIGLVGLIDDLTQRISPAQRLVLMTIVVASALAVQPSLLPGPIDFWVLNEAFNHPIVIAIGATVIVVGFSLAAPVVKGLSLNKTSTAGSVLGGLASLKACASAFFGLGFNCGCFDSNSDFATTDPFHSLTLCLYGNFKPLLSDIKKAFFPEEKLIIPPYNNPLLVLY